MPSSSSSSNKWFPKALTRKLPVYDPAAKCTICLFYHYVRPRAMSTARCDRLRVFLERLTDRLEIGGRIRYAQEGLNCTISGTHENVRTFSQELSSNSADSSSSFGFGPEFVDADFKYIDDLPASRAFKDLRMMPVKELVFYGVGEAEAPLSKGGVHLRPKAYHEKLKEDNTVVVDVRNTYEAIIGKFVGQEKEGGAEYIDPKMRKSTDFKNWLDLPATQEKLEGKQVMLYCTGGVRCERASALINHKIGTKVKGVYQLHGGVEKYMQEFKDGGFWRGLNYVFDKREGVRGGSDDVAGVGGVVGKKSKKKVTKKSKKNKKRAGRKDSKSEENDEGGLVLGRCCVCHTPWERYVGKKKCYTCGVPVLMCDSCMSLKVDKSKGRELEVRCTLCKEEKITLPASMTTWVDNGEGAVPLAGAATTGRSAKSVVKWGGGASWGSKKAKKKRKEKRSKDAMVKLSKKRKDSGGVSLKKPCRFGNECTREGCWFAHPRDPTPAQSKKQKLVVATKQKSPFSGKKMTFGDSDSD